MCTLVLGTALSLNLHLKPATPDFWANPEWKLKPQHAIDRKTHPLARPEGPGLGIDTNLSLFPSDQTDPEASLVPVR